MKGGQRKMEVCTVSSHGGQLKAHCRAGANTHTLLIPEFLSSHLQPSIPSLIFISASVMRTKESTHSFAPSLPSSLSLLSSSLGLFRQGLQSWLAIVTWPHGGKIGTHAQTHTGPSAHTCIRIHAYVAKRRTRASFARSNYPLSKA